MIDNERPYDGEEAASSAPPDRIAFGSCNSQHYPDSPIETTLWPTIVGRNPAAFLWTGDAIYADDFYPASSSLQWMFGKPVPKPADPQHIQDDFRQLLDSPGYRMLMNSNATILGAIDDHDYGANNGDSTYPHKRESNTHYVDFLRASNRHLDESYATASTTAANLTIMARRANAGKGVYGVKVFDFSRGQRSALLTDQEAGLEPEVDYNDETIRAPLSNRSVAVFLLDVRSNKDPWPSGRWRDKYQLDYAADFLGDEQWAWLEAALSRSKARINLVVQGLQVHADRYFDGNTVESWSRFPSSQHRLYQTILKSGVSAPILLSGDVHMSELLLKDCRQPKLEKTDNPADRRRRYLLEVTASGMTHSWGGPSICARPLSSLPCQSPTVAYGLQTGMHWAHLNGAWTDLVDTRDPDLATLVRAADGTPPGVQYVLQRNFGELEFDWDRNELVVRLFGHGRTPLLSTAWNLDSLDADHPISPTISPSTFENVWKDLHNHGSETGGDDWICINYRGQPTFLLKLYGVLTPVLLAGAVMSLPVLLPAAIAYLILSRRRIAATNATKRCTNESNGAE